MNRKKFSTNSGLPVNFLRSSGSCVATPTGQVFRWQTRIITQPMTTSGAVAKPYSSAPEQRADDDVAAGLELAVDLHDDPVAQLVQDQHLLRLGEPELPRQPGVLEAGERRRARPAVMPRNQHHVRMRLRDAGGDRADPSLGDELDVDARLRIRVLQVVNELRQVLDRIDVVVRRRRNQPDVRRREPRLRNPRVDLRPRKLAALSRLGALRHLDLQIVGVDEVLARDAEPRRRDLLDRAATRVAVRVGHVAAGSSPPSPVFDRPPSRFIAIASVSCASPLIEPYDIAPVENRFRIDSIGSTSSIGDRGTGRLQAEQSRAASRGSRSAGPPAACSP